ncbi:prephenate dehydrogenase [Streptomyces piniterrae]|uniref:Prephenate dehydrogenase n=1 Tax=Streptomyces piniterrae TaxID=2571125 RepID=A0A4U0NJK1_9ACTN|nr:prephenate dehydrogenase [Streptomyces piniterrae]TJZ54485.1 prephenate dehydrogenase [Streptomyces piniterrae]
MHTAAVVGTGLIGTSIALALTSRGVTTHLIDRDPHSVRLAAARGAGTPQPPSAPVDIAVICVPPSVVARTIADHQKDKLATVYTDVSSVKALPHAECLALGCDTSALVGGHPLAGRERSGPLSARADLFKDRHWVLTPTPETSETALNRALELVSLCGAVPVLLEPPDHDRAVALVSHLPHLVASLTAARLLEGEDHAVRLAGRGIRDVTRIAAGDAALWTDILAANAAALVPLLAELTRDLERTADALARLTEGPTDQQETALADLTDLLRRGSEGRARIATTYGVAGPGGHTMVSVSMADPDRRLERLLDDVSAARVDLEDMLLPDTTAAPLDSVELLVAPDAARPLTDALRDRGWAVH